MKTTIPPAPTLAALQSQARSLGCKVEQCLYYYVFTDAQGYKVVCLTLADVAEALDIEQRAQDQLWMAW